MPAATKADYEWFMANDIDTAGAVGFGFSDSKGRALGVLWSVTAHPGRTCEDPRYAIAPGTLFANVAAARSGARFGAMQFDHRVASMDEAFAYIAKRASGTYARSAKLAVR